MQQIKVYIASKVEHAAKLKSLREDGFHINARWIDTAVLTQNALKPVTHWQQENFDDICASHYVVFYVEPGDKLKGALVELGYAIAWGKKIWIAGDGHEAEVPHKDILPWGRYRQNIRIVSSLAEAFKQMRTLTRTEKLIELDGSKTPKENF